MTTTAAGTTADAGATSKPGETRTWTYFCGNERCDAYHADVVPNGGRRDPSMTERPNCRKCGSRLFYFCGGLYYERGKRQ